MATAPKLTARPSLEPARDAALDAQSEQAKLVELAALIAGIRDEVRARHAVPAAAEIPLVALDPLQRARDAAERQAASIGRVNPRNPGLVNDAIQSVKRLVARALHWFVRDQITFNREVIRSLNATIESLQETNRALRATLSAANAETHAWSQRLQTEQRRLEAGAVEQRAETERRQLQLEVSFEQRLQAERSAMAAAIDRSARDFEAAMARSAREFEAKTAATAREWQAKSRESEQAFEQALTGAAGQMQQLVWAEQKKVWDAFAQARREYEALIHEELRLVRQRAAASTALPELPASAPAPAFPPAVDWMRFAGKFRGPEDYVRQSHEIYIERFRGRCPVVDIGCGRGEFLELLSASGTDVTGVESNPELVALCRSKNLKAECADGFAFLEATAPGSFGGILCSQMLEHLEPGAVIRFIRLAYRALRPGGLLALETPNPECLAIFSTHFYADPSHTRPIPPALMAFHLEEAGFGEVRIERLHPALESMPALAELPPAFRDAFFGALDYAAFAVKL